MAPEMVPFNLSLGIDARPVGVRTCAAASRGPRAIGRAGVLTDEEAEAIVRGLGEVAARIEREGLERRARRGHPLGRGTHARRGGRRRGRQAPHRALPERPVFHRRAALRDGCLGPDHLARPRSLRRPPRSGGARVGRGHARIHAPPAGPAAPRGPVGALAPLPLPSATWIACALARAASRGPAARIRRDRRLSRSRWTGRRSGEELGFARSAQRELGRYGLGPGLDLRRRPTPARCSAYTSPDSPRISCSYSSVEFGFVRLSDGYSTGSSLMPQKRNPRRGPSWRGARRVGSSAT